MEDKLKYPIKYGIMAIQEKTGWSYGSSEFEREYSVVAYIVSKVYLISKKIEYKNDGSQKKSYDVVFPYQIGEYNGKLEINLPSYNVYGQCINANTVDELFNSYEEAIAKSHELNSLLLKNKLLYHPADKLEEINKQHYKLLKKYENIEKEIEKNTINMEVTEISSSKEIASKVKTLGVKKNY